MRRYASETLMRLGDLAHLWAVLLWNWGEDLEGE
jgi:hypothetical protein